VLDIRGVPIKYISIRLTRVFIKSIFNVYFHFRSILNFTLDGLIFGVSCITLKHQIISVCGWTSY